MIVSRVSWHVFQRLFTLASYRRITGVSRASCLEFKYRERMLDRAENNIRHRRSRQADIAGYMHSEKVNLFRVKVGIVGSPNYRRQCRMQLLTITRHPGPESLMINQKYSRIDRFDHGPMR
jgi:hypothetical protein